MNAGALNRRVEIHHIGSTQDTIGQPVQTWTLLAMVWAEIKLKTGMQTIKSDTDVSIVQASIRVRYRTDVNASMRVVDGGTTYQVLAVLPDVRRKEYLDLVCQVVR